MLWPGMLFIQRQYLYLLIVPIVLLTFWLIPLFPRWNPEDPYITSVPEAHAPPRETAENATLGFQAILALSNRPSWRTRGLLAAANYTGLDIQIPPQPPLHPDVIDAFWKIGQDDESIRRPEHGAAVAWLAHLDLVKFVVQSNLDTALIMEDDVDWDVSIREQMKLVSDAVRNFTKTPETQSAPYGRAWDVLWIGHCGEYWAEGFETFFFEDPAVCPHSKYLGWAKQYIERLPDYRRAVYQSFNPVCSFAYALSREGARNVLKYVGGGKGEAFDIKLMETCKAKTLNCISVVPELFHQYFPPESFAVKSEVDIGNGEQTESNEADFEKVMGSTENILESARCHALFGKSCLKV